MVLWNSTVKSTKDNNKKKNNNDNNNNEASAGSASQCSWVIEEVVHYPRGSRKEHFWSFRQRNSSIVSSGRELGLARTHMLIFEYLSSCWRSCCSV